MQDQIEQIPSYDMADYDRAVASLYAELPQLLSMNMGDRIELVSRQFLGKPYQLGALGEGPDGRFDQNPLYRLDAFDCVTYVNTVVALALSHDVNSFQRNMTLINYRAAQVDYKCRHHFITTDWNVENAELGIVEDITTAIVDEWGKPIYKIAQTVIDRPNWFRHKHLSALKLLHPLKKGEAEKLLDELHAIGAEVDIEKCELPYLPISHVVDEFGAEDKNIFAQIPHGAVLELVRPDWDLSEEIGTRLNVSHVGFAVRDEEGVMQFRNASTITKCVHDDPLSKYLFDRISSPTIRGINVQKIRYEGGTHADGTEKHKGAKCTKVDRH